MNIEQVVCVVAEQWHDMRPSVLVFSNLIGAPPSVGWIWSCVETARSVMVE